LFARRIERSTPSSRVSVDGEIVGFLLAKMEAAAPVAG
jgi:hypothetical protein